MIALYALVSLALACGSDDGLDTRIATSVAPSQSITSLSVGDARQLCREVATAYDKFSRGIVNAVSVESLCRVTSAAQTDSASECRVLAEECEEEYSEDDIYHDTFVDNGECTVAMLDNAERCPDLTVREMVTCFNAIFDTVSTNVDKVLEVTCAAAPNVNASIFTNASLEDLDLESIQACAAMVTRCPELLD